MQFQTGRTSVFIARLSRYIRAVQLNDVLAATALAFLLAACSQESLIPVENTQLLAKRDTTVILDEEVGDTVGILYTGCGGLVIGDRNSAILMDPYYSPHRISFPNIFGISASKENERRVLDTIRRKLIDPGKIGTVLISHSHYDHLENLPGLLQNGSIRKPAHVVGSISASVTVRHFLEGHGFTDIEGLAAAGRWIGAAPGMSVLPIRSSHAPHFHFGITAMKGNTDPGDFERFTHAYEKTRPLAWKEGGTYSYLVDIFSGKPKKKLRLFIQESASEAPSGLPPPGELKDPVDVAILCFASHGYVKFYPDSVLNYLKPKKTLIIHWEDFFEDMYAENPNVVKLSSEARFVEKLRTVRWVNDVPLSRFFIMPRPLTCVRVAY
jgi:hypothetical protein